MKKIYMVKYSHVKQIMYYALIRIIIISGILSVSSNYSSSFALLKKYIK